MGCIRTKDIKKAALKLFKTYRDKFTTDFEKNKNVVKELNLIEEKKTRNKVAGYLVRIVKQNKNN